MANAHSPMSRASSLDPYPRLIALAVLVPALVVAIDNGIMSSSWMRGKPWQLTLVYTFFAFQTALVSVLVGYGLQHRLLRILVFLWTLVLVDLTLFGLAHSQPMYLRDSAELLTVALLSAQLGLLVTYTVLGGQRWIWLPVSASLIALLILFVGVATRDWQAVWSKILVAQVVATIALSGALRKCSYWLDVLDQVDVRSSDGPRDTARPVQFSIRHLLTCTTALAPIFAATRLLDDEMFKIGNVVDIVAYLSMGSCLGFISLLALWAALGQESLELRLGLLVVLTPMTGLLLGCTGEWGWWESIGFYAGRWPVLLWVWWCMLSGFSLAGLLLYFRAIGLRLWKIG